MAISAEAQNEVRIGGLNRFLSKRTRYNRHLQQQSQRLADPSCCSEEGNFSIGVGAAGEGSPGMLQCLLGVAKQSVHLGSR